MRENHQRSWSVDSNHKGPVMRKAVPCHDVFIDPIYFWWVDVKHWYYHTYPPICVYIVSNDMYAASQWHQWHYYNNICQVTQFCSNFQFLDNCRISSLYIHICVETTLFVYSSWRIKSINAEISEWNIRIEIHLCCIKHSCAPMNNVPIF